MMIYLGLSAKEYVGVAGPDRFWSFLGRTGKDRFHNSSPDRKNQPFKRRDDDQEFQEFEGFRGSDSGQIVVV
jgi:hypothetical protein